MICVAHRGASGDFPENTLLAFRKALAMGATWLELDVHLTADDELAVIHDETLDRTTDGSGAVRHCTLQRLRSLDAGGGEPVPLLEEVLALLGETDTLNIELKGAGSAEATALLLQKWMDRGQLTADNLLISSFSVEDLWCVKQQLPKLRLALICDRLTDRHWEAVDSLGLWSLHLERTLVNEKVVAGLHRRGVRVLVFTVNQNIELKRLQDLGVDGVFTDFPADMLTAGASSPVR